MKSKHVEGVISADLAVCCRYAIVTRPVRQGRLKLALEEVLSSQPNPADSAPLQSADSPIASHIAAGDDELPAHDDSSASCTASAAAGAPTESAFRNAHQDPSVIPNGATHMAWSPAALGQGQNGQSELPLLHSMHSRPSQMSSGQLSNASEASGGLLPTASDLSRRQTSSPSTSHNTDFDLALQSRRTSLHRAPKVQFACSFCWPSFDLIDLS